MTWPTLRMSALVPASLFAALTWTGPSAHADPDPVSVAAYLQTLDQAHIPYDNPAQAIDLGDRVCQQSRGGTGFDDVAQSVIGEGFTPGQAGIIMGAAAGTLCPDMQPAMDRWSNT
ncbi:DUF732 domain-containing protein [Mycobacterium sp. Marseille-P9652]|uniref:DUF732 domain-containing protein n=1 Tax=Mycobacterium sp. Marseille-P9652 TaxID=2654950 RepID=UPI0012E8779D|nr:DUF732 domain-containing protein [Mycobacterium sp. Marseille-P9652]